MCTAELRYDQDEERVRCVRYNPGCLFDEGHAVIFGLDPVPGLRCWELSKDN